jgi:hypothetical protein
MLWSLWLLRLVLLCSVALKVLFPSTDTRLPLLVAVLELALLCLSFVSGRWREIALLSIYGGFVGAGLVTLAGITLDPTVGRTACGCLGNLIELRRDYALALQGCIVILAWLSLSRTGVAAEAHP